MRIFEARIKLKPDADVDKMLKKFNEQSVPVYRKIPGCISANILKYDESAEWDYALVVIWESEEARKKAHADKAFDEMNKEGDSGTSSMIDEVSRSIATVVASSK